MECENILTNPERPDLDQHLAGIRVDKETGHRRWKWNGFLSHKEIRKKYEAGEVELFQLKGKDGITYQYMIPNKAPAKRFRQWFEVKT